jgi:hypothetical protein
MKHLVCRSLCTVLVTIGLLATMSIPPTGLVHAQPVCHTSAFDSVAPPADFNPLTASAADLACYAIPARPSDPQSLQAWTHIVSNFKHWEQIVPVTPPVAWSPQSGVAAVQPQSVGSPATSPGDAGYTLWGNAQPYTQPFNWNLSWIEWKQELPDSPGPQSQYPYAEVGNWAGLGGMEGTSCGLVQAGTVLFSNSSIPGPYWFWEILPAQPNFATFKNVAIGPTDTLAAYVSFSSSNSTANMCVVDVSKGGAYTCTNPLAVGLTGGVTDTADAIYEDMGGSQHNGEYSPIHDPIQFVEAIAGGTDGHGASHELNFGAAGFVASPVTMQFGSTQWAIPTVPPNSSTGAFNVCYQRTSC